MDRSEHAYDFDALEHFGIKGMRWGRRKSGVTRGSAAKKSPTSVDAARSDRISTKAKTHGIKSLSNMELRDLTARMNLEQSYGRLLDSHKKTKSAGKEFVKTLLQDIAKDHIRSFAKSSAKSLLDFSQPKSTGKSVVKQSVKQTAKPAFTMLPKPKLSWNS